MKRRKVLAFIMSFMIATLSIVPAHAETTETDLEQEDVVVESEIQYEVRDIFLESETVEVGSKQVITILMNDTQKIENATLVGFTEDKGVETRYEYTSLTGTEIIFEINHNEADRYTLQTLMIETAYELLEYDLSGYEDISYVVTSLEKGDMINNGISFFSVNQFTGVNGDDGVFVIVLDPGHDPGCNTRGWVNGVWETELNWKIAEAMKEELEIYSGVEVYINRVWEECPGETDGLECLKARVTRAANLKADLVISIHNNALGSGELQNSASGAEVYVTQYPAYHMESKALAEKVLNGLEEMGLKNNGVRTRYYGDDAEDTYDDGTGWDYYAINRHSTLMGIPSLLIEHAYMDNTYDLSFLKDSDKLREIGRRDAEAIIEYYDLPLVTENGMEAEIMYRLYNPNSGEHFYTSNKIERNHLIDVGWNYEGVGWYAPETGNPVYRLYNPNAGDHHYTLSSKERDYLVSVGWNYEGIGWYSDLDETVPLYRLYNPNAITGTHHYTTNYNEAKYLDEIGWNYEGIGWYGISAQ